MVLPSVFFVGAIHHTIAPSIYKTLDYDLEKDFVPITMLVGSPYGLAVNPSLPATNVREMLAYAKANPSKFNYAMLGSGSASHLAGIELGARAGVPFTFVADPDGYVIEF